MFAKKARKARMNPAARRVCFLPQAFMKKSGQ